jgi:hypothetical protein
MLEDLTPFTIPELQFRFRQGEIARRRR